MFASNLALVVLAQSLTPLPTGHIYLGTASGDGILPGLLIVGGTDSLAIPVSIRVTALPTARLWWRPAEQACGGPPREVHSAIEWNDTLRGDAELAFCVDQRRTGTVRLAATLKQLQPEGSARIRVIASEAIPVGGPFYSSGVFLAVVTAGLGFLSGVVANWIQLSRQQKGDRLKRQLELAEERATDAQRQSAAERQAMIALELKVFDSVTKELQANVAALRKFLATTPQAGEEAPILPLAGLGVILEDPGAMALFRDGARAEYFARIQGAYREMLAYDNAVFQASRVETTRSLATELQRKLEVIFSSDTEGESLI